MVNSGGNMVGRYIASNCLLDDNNVWLSSNNHNGSWIEIDLKKQSTIKSFKVRNLNSSWGRKTGQIRISGKINNQWSIISEANLSDWTNATGNIDNQNHINQNIRYLKVELLTTAVGPGNSLEYFGVLEELLVPDV